MLLDMALWYLDSGQPLLDERFPLPLDQPFTTAQAARCTISTKELSRLVREGFLRRLVPGVYVAAQRSDSLALRAEALKLVVPPDAVVTDRTAGWLHGANRILAPGAHLEVPTLSVFHRARGGRLRNDLTSSGQRMMPESDVMVVDGVQVTTPLRTACDLGRVLHRDQAFAALDAMLGLEAFTKDELLEASSGFKGYRWVRQLRQLAPSADPRSHSPEESILRLRWIDCSSLPRPEPQRPVRAPAWVPGGHYFIDVGVDELRFGMEYDGEHFHGPDQQQHDEDRRHWITQEERWTLRVVRKRNLHGPHADIETILFQGVTAARACLATQRRYV